MSALERKAAEAERGGGRGTSPCRSQPHLKLKNILAQIIAASSKYLIMLNIGMGISYPTVAIPPILNAAKGLSITDDESTWFASLVFIFQPVGSLASISVSSLGRKRSMFYLQIPLFIAWLLPYFAESVWELYFAASVMGIGIGFMQAPIATYIGEVTQPRYRGTLACIAYCFLTLGSVLVYAIDVINGNWRHTALYCSCMPILTAVLLYMIPESPVWLVAKGRHSEARKALAWLRGWVSEADVEAEFKNILCHNDPNYRTTDSEIPSVSAGFELDHIDPLCKGSGRPRLSSSKENLAANSPTGSPQRVSPTPVADLADGCNEKPKKQGFFTMLPKPEMYKPLILETLFLYCSNGIGVATFRPYLIIIFKGYHVNIDEYIATVAVTMIGLIGNIVSVIMMQIVGKRRLSLVAMVLCAIGSLALGFYTIFGQQLNMTWIPVAIMILIFFATNLAVGHMPWVLMSELFPLCGRTIATASVAGLGNFLQFLGTKLYITFNDLLTLGGTFIMYGITFVIGTVYLYFFLFETEGKTLDEISDTFRGKKNKKPQDGGNP